MTRPTSSAESRVCPYRDLLVCKCGHSVDRHPGTWLCTECPCILLEPTATTAHLALGAYRVPCPYCGAEPYYACQAKSDNGWPRGPHAARVARASARGRKPMTPIPPGTPPPKVTVEVWDGEDQIDADASVADVVRIDDTWHVVVTLDG